jgi:hypothetical protein
MPCGQNTEIASTVMKLDYEIIKEAIIFQNNPECIPYVLKKLKKNNGINFKWPKFFFFSALCFFY